MIHAHTLSLSHKNTFTHRQLRRRKSSRVSETIHIHTHTYTLSHTNIYTHTGNWGEQKTVGHRKWSQDPSACPNAQIIRWFMVMMIVMITFKSSLAPAFKPRRAEWPRWFVRRLFAAWHVTVQPLTATHCNCCSVLRILCVKSPLYGCNTFIHRHRKRHTHIHTHIRTRSAWNIKCRKEFSRHDVVGVWEWIRVAICILHISHPSTIKEYLVFFLFYLQCKEKTKERHGTGREGGGIFFKCKVMNNPSICVCCKVTPVARWFLHSDFQNFFGRMDIKGTSSISILLKSNRLRCLCNGRERGFINLSRVSGRLSNLPALKKFDQKKFSRFCCRERRGMVSKFKVAFLSEAAPSETPQQVQALWPVLKTKKKNRWNAL